MRILTSCFLLLTSFFAALSQEVFSPRDPGETPNRSYHVVHYRIEVVLHDETKSLDGKMTATLVPLLSELETVEFNAGNLNVSAVTDRKGDALKFRSSTSSLFIDLGRKATPRDTVVVTVDYSCKPREGLTFNGPDEGYPNKRPQIWSQGEDTTNHFWFPCFDHPNDKATSEVIGTVKSAYTLLSNGKLVSTTEDKKRGTKTFHWVQNKPQSTYLIMIAAGEYAILHDRVGNLPLEYYVYPDDTSNARESFKYTPSMISFFDEMIGYPFAWDKYAQIILQDHFGGMENSSATTLADDWAVPDIRMRQDVDPRSLLAHELAHQWWGDVVTCKDFRHLWLNESFATYYDALYQEHSQGADEFDNTMYQDQQSGILSDTTRGRKPIVSVESYGANIYPRGASVLHMLRFVLGDDLYHRGLLHYITKHQFQPVETNDLKVAIEEATGQNLQWFFDEWIYKAGYPVFALSYQWNPPQKSISLSVRQVQKMDSLTGVFRMPVDVEVVTASGSETRRIGILSKDSTYDIPCSDKPLMVLFDKGNRLLKELKWEKSFDEWKFQASIARLPSDRIRALQALAIQFPGPGTASILAEVIRNDRFWSVRREAAQRAGTMAATSDTTKPILKPALMAALRDSRAAVRIAAAGSLGSFKEADVVAGLRKALEDSSYNVVASALRSLARVDSAHTIDLAMRDIDYPSRYSNVPTAAIAALSSLDSARALTAALRHVRYGEKVGVRFASMGVLRRFGKGKQDVMEVVAGLLKDKNDNIKQFAAGVLGDIGDSSVLPELEALLNDSSGGFYLFGESAVQTVKASIEKVKKRTEEKNQSGKQ